MAVAAVFSAAATQVGNLLTQEAKFLWGVEDKVKRLHREIIWMQSFLKEADARQAEDERVRQWAIEIRDIAYDVEDVIETFALNIASKRKGGCAHVMKRCACILKEGWMLHKVRSEIEEITERINDLTRRLQTYGIKQLSEGESSSSVQERKREWRRSYPHIAEENVVGFDDKISELVSVLVDGERDVRVVSIFGMGGIGKTTLAKKVYNHHRARSHFSHLAWVYVSQQCDKKNVWSGILSCLDPTFDQRDMFLRSVDPQQLAERLYCLLQGKRYLVVLDYVWSTQDWDSLKPGFPIERTGSKILVTSRNKDVALHIDPRVYLHELECLTDEDSWELFRKIVLIRRDSTDCAIEAKMEVLGKKIVHRCGGLPLAITAIGGILATKDCTYQEWQIIHDNVKSYLRQGKSNTVQDSLSLSYDDLPPYLKPCFLYLAHFPEDYEIPVQKLIHMWVAEGIISSQTDLDDEIVLEDIAESYLIELLDRCMIRVGKRHANLKIKTCRMHDLIRDLCLSKSKLESFLDIVGHSHDKGHQASIFHSALSMTNYARRLAVHKSAVIRDIKNSHLRTLLFFSTLLPDQIEWYPENSLFRNAFSHSEKHRDEMSCNMCLVMGLVFYFALHNLQLSISHIFNNFKKLRILDLEGGHLLGCNQLKNIGSLIHLRYLCLANAEILKLPSSLGELMCLQTLDLRVDVAQCGIPKIPDVIWRLEQLRHLYLPKTCTRRARLRLGNLTKLQTLVNFPTNNCNLRDLSTLTNLRELSMHGDEDYLEDIDRFCADNCCFCMETIMRKGGHYMGLQEDPMPILEKLPNLRILVLEAGAVVVNEMVCSPGGFPQLESLTLDSLTELEELRVGEGALSILFHFKVKDCKKLKMLPDGLRYVTTLQKVDSEEMSKDFINRWNETTSATKSGV